MKSRLSHLHYDDMTKPQQLVLEDILKGPRRNLDGPFLAWIHSPELANHAQKLGAFCRYHTQLPLVLSELAILTTASLWQSQAEWQIHEPIALEAGLSKSIIEAIRLKQVPEFENEAQSVVYQLTKTLYETKRVNQGLYDKAVSLFGESALVELVGVLGYYALVAMTLNVFAVDRETGQPLPFIEP
ncbi:carboxymuconolactone decarboxylase family protein [Nitrincola tibetensis]|uniref:Carboxymuconolactone decarboxylase family protein n=1 Tax=Nitrincola tibetensis TaxID=2219697 RepID=A0A364NME1_9GAMM|nr:carboxymuconolactone decarboxylase family protein [Nitrincola tibetensis]RAU18047.1 carboxymuconolactone decarboxylase family protein [Nitrincola tibetensis]